MPRLRQQVLLVVMLLVCGPQFDCIRESRQCIQGNLLPLGSDLVYKSIVFPLPYMGLKLGLLH
jgi:hypothetical protein